MEIPFPVTLDEYLRGNKFQGSSIRRDGLLIDDLDVVLDLMFRGIPIREVTLTDHENIEMLASKQDPYRFHDLVEDPTDLPAKYGEDFVLVKLSYPGILDEYFRPIIADYRSGHWYRDDLNSTCLDDLYKYKVLGWFKIYDPCKEEK